MLCCQQQFILLNALLGKSLLLQMSLSDVNAVYAGVTGETCVIFAAWVPAT